MSAAQAGGDAGQGDGQAQGEAQSGPDLGAMVDQIGQIASGQEEMRQFLASNPWQPQQEAEAEAQGDELDLSWLDPQATQYEDPSAVAQRLSEQINGAVDQRAQALIAPVLEQQAEMRRDQQARDLAAEFPELAEPEMAQRVAGKGGLAEQVAEQLGQPNLAAEPSFWRLVYMAHKAAESAGGENGSGDPRAAALESGGGPGPAAQTNEDIVKGIMDSGGRGSKVLDFRV